MNSIFWTFLIAIFILCYMLVKKRYNYWANRGFIQTKTSFPFGSMSGVATELMFIEKCDQYYKEFKGKAPAVGAYNLLSPLLILTDIELVKDITVRDFDIFNERGIYYNKEDDPMMANILSLGGQEWKDRRVKFTPMFTSGKMKMMFEIIDSIGDKFVSSLENDLKKSNICEMQNWSQRYTCDVIGSTAFGIDPMCLDDKDSLFLVLGKKFLHLSTFDSLKIFFAMSYPDLARKLGILFLSKDTSEFFHKTFLQTFIDRQKNPVNRNDFVQMLLNLKDKFTPTELAAEAFVMYIAGFETSSTLMQFTLYELALNPHIQDRLRREIIDEIKKNEGKLTYEMIFGFKYLDMVIQETLRKYPPIPNTFRRSTRDYQISNTKMTIPKDTFITVNMFSFHRDPEYFPNPEKFDPERFNDENIEKIQPYTFFPFGVGPRVCLGERFGLLQAKTGIAKLIKKFIFTPYEKTLIPMKFEPTVPSLSPVGGMYLNVRKIS